MIPTEPDGYRRDPMTDTWVLIAPARGGVPHARDRRSGLPAIDGPCPFCPGRESETEPTIHAVPGEPDWRVRVVGNRYPAVRPQAHHTGDADRQPAHGHHEVVIEAREHDLELDDFSPGHARTVLEVYRERVRALERMPGIRHVAVFRNRGQLAGSSQPHPHGQIAATAVLGPTVERRSAQARAHAEGSTGDTLLEHVLDRELREGSRVVETTDALAVLCPFAPHRAYETWIAARGRVSRGSFADAEDAVLEALARVLPRTVARVRRASGRSDYTLLVRCPPVGEPDGAAFWYVQVLPPARGAGFEATTGMDLIPVAPERSAEALRELRMDGGG